MRVKFRAVQAGILMFVAIGLGLCFITPANADRGHWVIESVKPNVSVYNAGQKAIIGWNGEEELLILSTDLSTDTKAKVLEFLPLPSKPIEVKKEAWQAFNSVEQIIREHAPRLVPPPSLTEMGGGGTTEERGAVEIVFHQQIEVHDITIAKVNDAKGFMAWARDFVKQQGGVLPDAREGLTSVVESYLSRGYNYFVFDIIDLAETKKNVPPISYRFKTDHLFFPLLVSSLDKGECDISLFLITNSWPDIQGMKTGFSLATYDLPGNISEDQKRAMKNIRFSLTGDDLKRISHPLEELFRFDSKYFSSFDAVKYTGPASALKEDFIIRLSPQRLKELRERRGPRYYDDDLHDPQELKPVGYLPQSAGIRQLVWSPKGDKLCIEEWPTTFPNPFKAPALILVNPEGGPMQALTLEGRISSQCWSPDGQKICYLDCRRKNIGLFDLKAKTEQQLTDFYPAEDDLTAFNTFLPPVWSPSDEWIAFSMFRDVWIIRPDGRDLRRITELADPPFETGDKVKTPMLPARSALQWSPDGNSLLYQESVYSREKKKWFSTLHLYDAAKNISNLVPLPEDFLNLWGIRWSPDSKYIAIAGEPAREKREKNAAWVISADGSQKKLLPDMSYGLLCWLPEGHNILARGFRGFKENPEFNAFVVNTDTGETTILGNSRFLSAGYQNAYQVSFRPGSTKEIVLSRGNKIYLTQLDGSARRELAQQIVFSSEIRPDKDNPIAWKDNPIVREAAAKWKEMKAKTPYDEKYAQPWEQFFQSPFRKLYRSLTDAQKTAAQEPDGLAYASLTPEKQNYVLLGMALDLIDDAQDYPGEKPYDPLSLSAPEWYWKIDDVRVGFERLEEGDIVLMGRQLGKPQDWK